MLNEILHKAEKFLNRTRWVHIEETALQHLADELSRRLGSEPMRLPTWDGAAFAPHLDSIEEVSQFFFIGNSINYRFWQTDHTNVYRFASFRGSEAMWAALTAAPELLHADTLSGLTWEHFQHRFKDLPLPEQRVQSLREVGGVLSQRYKGQIINLIEEANFYAPDIVLQIASQFPRWHDASESLDFHKRAQLFVGMVAGRFQASVPISGLEQLTVLADYHVPKGLHKWGVLQYDQDLVTRIQNRVLIPPGSEEELAIRAATVTVGGRLEQRLREQGHRINCLQIDSYLWSMSKKVEDPYHLTNTICY